MQNIDFKNTKIAYSDIGKGSVIVLLHGFLENSTMWHALSPTLAKRNRIIAIDLLGHGETGCLGYSHTMELMAEAVNAVLKHLRIRKIIFIGHSLGGYVTLAFAEKYPEKIKGFCLLNSTALADDDDRKKLRTRSNVLIQKNFKNIVRMSFANLFRKESRTTYAQEINAAITEALKTPLQGYIAAQEGMKLRPDRTSVLKNLSVEKLMIIGEKDPVLDYETAIKEARETNCLTVKFPDGHMSHIENKDSLSLVLKEFVKKC